MGKGMKDEKEKQDKPVEGDPEEEERAKLPEKIKRGEEVSYLNRKLTFEDEGHRLKGKSITLDLRP